jgi:hypothetical protein
VAVAGDPRQELALLGSPNNQTRPSQRKAKKKNYFMNLDNDKIHLYY